MATGPCVLGGCASHPSPTVELIGAKVTERTEQGVSLALTLRAQNPNEYALPLGSVRYSVRLSGAAGESSVDFAGMRMAQATLRRYGSQEIVLPVAVPAEQARALGDAIACDLTGEIFYRVPGEFSEALYDAGLRRPTVPVSGRVVLPAAP